MIVIYRAHNSILKTALKHGPALIIQTHTLYINTLIYKCYKYAKL